MEVHMLMSALQDALVTGRKNPEKGILMLKNLKIRIKDAGCQLNPTQGNLFRDVQSEITLGPSSTKDGPVTRSRSKPPHGVSVLEGSSTLDHTPLDP